MARTFDLATRFLPGPVRRDVRRLYLVLRTLDDLVDEGDPGADLAVAQVGAWVRDGAVAGREATILADLAARHPLLPRDAVGDFLDGMRADLAGPAHRTAADLDLYCYRVAGTVGRLMAAVLGVREGRAADADAAARALGCAMQRTNIVRDLVEDARGGRIYLDDAALAAAGIDPADAARLLADRTALSPEARAVLVGGQVARAEADYAAGLAGIGALRSGGRAIAAAARMYREIGRQVVREEHGARRDRVVISGPRKALLVARALIRPD
ncbi:MAG: phytoene/squalene synthase family protein [Chloroflexota bacterium]